MTGIEGKGISPMLKSLTVVCNRDPHAADETYEGFKKPGVIVMGEIRDPRPRTPARKYQSKKRKCVSFLVAEERSMLPMCARCSPLYTREERTNTSRPFLPELHEMRVGLLREELDHRRASSVQQGIRDDASARLAMMFVCAVRSLESVAVIGAY
jgi:hypothetical protein